MKDSTPMCISNVSKVQCTCVYKWKAVKVGYNQLPIVCKQCTCLANEVSIAQCYAMNNRPYKINVYS